MLGSRIRELREERGLTQEELGKILNLTKGNVSKYESSKLEPNIETIKLIANYFKVSTDYLLGRSEYRNYPHTRAAHIDEDEASYPITQKDLDYIEKLLKKARENIKKGQ